MATQVKLAFDEIQPDCVAVEFAETMQLQLLHAASRLPDISVVISYNKDNSPIYYLSEPCDAGFEALRTALENRCPAYCIDLDVDFYPDIQELIPDPYAIHRIGLETYYNTYLKSLHSSKHRVISLEIDNKRETYMAKRLKELSFSYERVLYIGGMAHVDNVLKLLDKNSFPDLQHANREAIQLCTLTKDSCQEVLAEYGWISNHYELARENYIKTKQTSPVFPPDRQKFLLDLYKKSAEIYVKNTGNTFSGYHLRNTMKFVRNYALLSGKLQPNLYQLLTAAKGCVDHNYSYETWALATEYSHLKNVDNLTELDLSIEDIWKHSKIIHFHKKEKSRKYQSFKKRFKKDSKNFKFNPPGFFSICSFQPEDSIIENFGEFLKKKGTQLIKEEGARVIPFSVSLEDGIDTKETIRHWAEKKLYVKSSGRPPGGVGSVIIVFNQDHPEELESFEEKYPWKTTWLGEHNQESDMAFYATPVNKQVIGPGISRCEYGGFLMSYPPQRMLNIWTDSDYSDCRTKAEALLMAGIDYSPQPVIVYVAHKPPRSFFKHFAARFGKKIAYIPIGQLSPVTLNKIRTFHVLDGHDKRDIADEYIF